MGWNLKSPRNEKINPSPKPHFSALVFGGASKLRGLVSIPPERPHFPMWMAWRTGRCACWMDIGRMVQRWRGWRWWLGQGRVMGVDLDWLGGASKWKGWLIFVKGMKPKYYSTSFLEVLQLPLNWEIPSFTNQDFMDWWLEVNIEWFSLLKQPFWTFRLSPGWTQHPRNISCKKALSLG